MEYWPFHNHFLHSSCIFSVFNTLSRVEESIVDNEEIQQLILLELLLLFKLTLEWTMKALLAQRMWRGIQLLVWLHSERMIERVIRGSAAAENMFILYQLLTHRLTMSIHLSSYLVAKSVPLPHIFAHILRLLSKLTTTLVNLSIQFWHRDKPIKGNG